MNLPTPQRGEVSAAQLVRRTGISYRVLDYWTTRGYLQTITTANPGSGQPRLYPASEVAIAARMRVLVDAGLFPAAAERAARGTRLAPGVHVVLDDAAAGLDVEAVFR
jgi:DNA-binding transcriptional MerR regulator